MRRRNLIYALCSVAIAACIAEEMQGAFDDDENDDSLDDGKADSVNAKGYRSGCQGPIRTGSYALKGDLALPTGIKTASYVVITDEKISAITTTAPTGMPIVNTGGVIFPGLIDGHGHVEYNHIPLADLGKRYGDRDQWPNASLYKTLVKDPKNAVTAAGIQCEALRHGEARALVGGTTAIQGTPLTACVRSLVRNIEGANFCQDRIRQNVMAISGFDRSISGKPSFTQSIKTNIANNQLDAFIVHAGEGIDAHAHAEWQQLKDQKLNVPQLVMIHTAAFDANDYKEIASAGAKVIWSPLSNLLLYGKTADIPSALAAGVLVSLGSDWAPSGSANLLGELKVADRVNQKQWNGVITDEELVQMVTINPATTFGWQKFVGSIEVGKTADLMVVAKKSGVSGYRSLINARPQDVKLVTISGDPLFGDPAMMDTLGKTDDYEVIDACGTPKAIDMTVAATDVTRGTQSLQTTESLLLKTNPKMTPVIDCTDDEARKSFVGTPMAY